MSNIFSTFFRTLQPALPNPKRTPAHNHATARPILSRFNSPGDMAKNKNASTAGSF
jgi:hypothetical protein